MKIIQHTIFGDVEEIGEKKTRAEIFNDYESFEKKFKPKKTTDDCYTPADVYEAIRGWVNDNVMDLSGVRVVRPFYPEGDYEKFDYQPGDLVLDNPPFSILAKIRKFYVAHDIKYFLFSPGLTLFSTCQSEDETYIVAAANIVYENGALIRTGFITNAMPGGLRVTVRGDLHKLIDRVQKARPAKNKDLPIYDYPANVISAARLQKLAERGINLDFPRAEVSESFSRLDLQKDGKAVFGRGFLISDKLAADKLAAEKLAAERLAAERLAPERLAPERLAERQRITYELSEREKKIIEGLNKKQEI